MEALSVGLRVVGYDSTGIGDLVAEGWVRGIRLGASAAAVAQTLVQAMSSPPLIDPAQLPTWDDCAEQILRLYITAGSTDASSSHAEISRSQDPIADLRHAEPSQ